MRILCVAGLKKHYNLTMFGDEKVDDKRTRGS